MSYFSYTINHKQALLSVNIKLAIILLVLLISCKENKVQNLSEYYYSLNTLDSGLVYEYRSINELNLAPEYWYYRSFPDTGFWSLVGQSYDQDFNVSQYIREKIVPSGALIKDLQISGTNNQMISADIQKANVFPFMVQDSLEQFLYSVKWFDSSDSIEYFLEKRRSFSHFEQGEVLGKKEKLAVFKLKENLETNRIGYTDSEWDAVEAYAKNLGLVYYKKEISPELIKEFALSRIMPMDSFELLFRPILKKEGPEEPAQ